MPDPTCELHDETEHIRDLKDYVYKRYVDGQPVERRDREHEILRDLHEAFSAGAALKDNDCYLPGVLAFELAVGKQDHDGLPMEQCLWLARHWLLLWKSVTEGEEWAPVDSRLREIDDWFGDQTLAGDAAEVLRDITRGMAAALGDSPRAQVRDVTGQLAAACGADPAGIDGAVSGDGAQ